MPLTIIENYSNTELNESKRGVIMVEAVKDYDFGDCDYDATVECKINAENKDKKNGTIASMWKHEVVKVLVVIATILIAAYLILPK